MKSYKDKIRESFSNSAARYDQYTDLQKKMSDFIFKLLTKEYETILEVGCGTGILAGKLAEKYPGSKIIGLDIAPGMINYSSAKIKHSNVSFIEGDGEALPFPDQKFDLVISSAALQWMAPEKAVSEASRVLKPGGRFIFSTFGPATLSELKKAGLSVNSFPGKEDFKILLNKYFNKADIRSEIDLIDYESPIEAFRYLKNIGANVLIERKTKGLLTKKKLISLFPQSEKGLTISFEIYYGDCVK